MAHLNVTVVNALGTFEGRIIVNDSDTTKAGQIMKNLIGNINSVDMLSLEKEEGEATVFGQEILRQSVITVKVIG